MPIHASPFMIVHPASACSMGLVTFHALPCWVSDSLSHAPHRNNEPPKRNWPAMIDRQGSPRHMAILSPSPYQKPAKLHPPTPSPLVVAFTAVLPESCRLPSTSWKLLGRNPFSIPGQPIFIILQAAMAAPCTTRIICCGSPRS